MIKSIAHKGLNKLFKTGIGTGVKQDHIRRLRIIITFLNEAHVLDDINFSGSELHALKGNKKNYWSVKVSSNWRVIFRYVDSNVYDVDYLDYH
ncbi:MAG: peptidase [Candidatus Dadabacteria bacterium]|nr:peptidase [Candidatus Dadabacteria bacterium]NIX15551.1 peptidase [Candidatus Dadabacteria bacterium]NIY22291.1 peptidase [Candidatus Dadabacteria bacterium]